MVQSPSPASPLQALAAKWQMLAMLLVLFARKVSLASTQGAQGQAAFAGMLEAQIYAALVQLSADIAAHSNGAAHARGEEEALVYLKSAHALLAVVALMVRQLRVDLETAAEMFAALAGGWTALTPGAIRPRADAPAFLDSG